MTYHNDGDGMDLCCLKLFENILVKGIRILSVNISHLKFAHPSWHICQFVKSKDFYQSLLAHEMIKIITLLRDLK